MSEGGTPIPDPDPTGEYPDGWTEAADSGMWIREFRGDGVFRDQYGNIWVPLSESVAASSDSGQP